jgi:F-type H+-transporting ATPase subunit delta
MTRSPAMLRYARALLDVAIAESDPAVIEQHLAAVTDLFTGHAGLWKVLTSAAVPAPKKRAIVNSLLPQLEIGPVLQKTLLMLAGRDRIGLLPDLLEAYRSRLLDHQKVVRADVTSAVPLPADRVQKLREELAALTGRTVVLTAATDASIIGGVVAQVGSTVYDGSVRRQLEKFRERLTGETR